MPLPLKEGLHLEGTSACCIVSSPFQRCEKCFPPTIFHTTVSLLYAISPANCNKFLQSPKVAEIWHSYSPISIRFHERMTDKGWWYFLKGWTSEIWRTSGRRVVCFFYKVYENSQNRDYICYKDNKLWFVQSRISKSKAMQQFATKFDTSFVFLLLFAIADSNICLLARKSQLLLMLKYQIGMAYTPSSCN